MPAQRDDALPGDRPRRSDCSPASTLVLLSTEPYVFRERDVAELAAMPALAGKPVALIDGEMTSWYGSRAIAGLVYLPRFRHSLANGPH